MEKTKYLLFLHLLGLLSGPSTLPVEAEAACPANCKCSRAAGDFLCDGGFFLRLPNVPPSFKHLRMTNPQVTEFSLGDLPLHLDTVSIRGLKAVTFSTKGPTKPSNVTKLEVEGCCADDFPNVSNFVRVTTFSFEVRCRGGGGRRVIDSTTIGDLGSRSRLRAQGSLRISDTCTSRIEQSALRRLFAFKAVYLASNRLTELSVGNEHKNGSIELLDVSANPSLRRLDLGENQIGILTLSGTKINISAVTSGKEKMTTLDYSQGNETLRISDVCGAFPGLVDLTTNDRLSLDLSEIHRCSNLQVLKVINSRQKTMPDLSKTKLYKFNAESNFYSQLDLSLIPVGISRLILKNNRIADIVFEKCGALRKLRSFDLSKNKLKTLPSEVLYCLGKGRELILSENPMQNIFKSYNDSVTSKVEFKELRIEALEKVQEVGKLPKFFIKHFAVIEQLYAGNNSLNSLSETIAILRYAGLHLEMDALRLERNKFQAVPRLLFLGFRRLQTLDLSHNDISAIDASAFAGLQSLKTLSLQSNRLSVLEPWFSGFPTTLNLDLSSNNLDCSCEAVQAMKKKIPPLFLNSSDFSNVRGLRCSSPKEMKHFPVTAAAEKTPSLCARTENDDVPSVLVPTSPPVPHSTILTSVLAVIAALLLLALVLTVVCVINKKRKMSKSYHVTKHSLITAV